MTPQEEENGRRTIARECLAELEKLENKSDEQHTAILDKYTIKFTPLNHMRFNNKDALCHYVRLLQKEK